MTVMLHADYPMMFTARTMGLGAAGTVAVAPLRSLEGITVTGMDRVADTLLIAIILIISLIVG
jgi:hypothetical protein